MRTHFDKATTIRLVPAVREEIVRLAEREGNSTAAIIRRALTAGLAVIGDRKPAGSPADRVPA